MQKIYLEDKKGFNTYKVFFVFKDWLKVKIIK